MRHFQMLPKSIEIFLSFVHPYKGAFGAVILVISIMQDKTETFISILACRKSLLMISAFIEGKSASCIDLDGSCSTYANNFQLYQEE